MTIPRTPQEAARLIAADMREMALTANAAGRTDDASLLRAAAFKYSTMAETWGDAEPTPKPAESDRPQGLTVGICRGKYWPMS